MNMKKINSLVIAALIISFTILGIFIMWRQDKIKEEEALKDRQEQYESCLGKAEEWYSNNIEALPRACENNGLEGEDCTRLYDATSNGRDNLRKEFKEQYLSS